MENIGDCLTNAPHMFDLADCAAFSSTLLREINNVAVIIEDKCLLSIHIAFQNGGLTSKTLFVQKDLSVEVWINSARQPFQDCNMAIVMNSPDSV